MKRMVLMTIVFGLALGLAVAQEAESADEDGRVQNCQVDAPLPQDPATADQGGFLFEYQSYRGVTEDGRVCTVYRLRNTSDKPPTPFRWALADEPIVDKARLGRCDADSGVCPWVVFVEYFAGAIDTNLSTLSYGLNADAFHEQAETYLSHSSIDGSTTAEATGVDASSVGKEIVGTFEAPDGSAVDVHVLVKSRFEPNPDGGVFLIYEVDDLAGTGALSSGPLRVAWDALTAIDPVGRLLERAERTGANEVTIEGAGTLTRTRDALAVTIPAVDFALDEDFGFHVMSGDDPEPIVSVQMGAYVPILGAY